MWQGSGASPPVRRGARPERVPEPRASLPAHEQVTGNPSPAGTWTVEAAGEARFAAVGAGAL
jgi:hypothetical protein